MNESVRTLFITVDAPYPPTSGAPLRNWQNICLAAAAGPVAVLSFGYDDVALTALPGVARYRHVTLLRGTDSGVRGFPLIHGSVAKRVAAEVAELMDTFAPTIAVLENVWIENIDGLVRSPRCRLVYDAHNAYGDLAQELNLDVAAVRAIEAQALASIDELWVCSEDDAERLCREYAACMPMHVIPNGIDTAYYQRIRARGPRAPREAITLVFVGSYWYEPNRIAAELLLDEIVPEVRARSAAEVRLVLVGAAPSPAMLASNDPGLVLAGRVPDVRPYLAAADAIVVPLRQGGGTRLKLLEAFAACRPVIATAKAAEGIDVRDGEHVLLRERSAEIADAVLQLRRDPVLAEHLTSCAYQLIAERYSWTALAPVVRAALVKAPLRAGDGAIRGNGARAAHLA
jgi:glycosyltransferase involved in cell wall biosynthesis